jgi:transcriptional regulator with XRE-family HTH domain
VKFDDLHREWMKDSEYRAAHAATEDEFALASALIGARARAGLTQDELARRMGTSQAAIARIESGRYLPSSRTLQRLAEATGTRLRISFSAAAAQPGKVSSSSIMARVLGTVEAHREGVTGDELVAYLAREFGMTVRPNDVGMALQRHRRAGKLEVDRDHRWFIPAVSRSNRA